MEEEQKIILFRLIVSILLFLIAIIIPEKYIYFRIVLFIVIYLISGIDVLKRAFHNILKHDAFDENILMTIATLGAFLIGEYNEAVFVMIFYQIGELFGDYHTDKSIDSFKHLIDIIPETANVLVDNNIKTINSKDVHVGDIVVVNPYEKIPVDGIVIEGSSLLNTSMLTGESIPRVVKIGDKVSSGLINNENVIKIESTNDFENSTANKIVKLIENANNKKSKSEKFITTFAKIYTPIVCLLALLTFVIPVLFDFFVLKTNVRLYESLYRALTILVISCPCAIVISIPLAFFSSLGVASKNGILIKGTNYIETLSKIKTFIFDKTGTMTKGVFEVVAIHHCVMDEKELIKIVAHIEHFSNHPIAKSILKYYNGPIDVNIVKNVKEISGKGLSGYVNDKFLLIGNEQLMKDNNIKYIECKDLGTTVHVAVNNKYEGHILVSDIIKENSNKALETLKKLGVKNNIMLSGDRSVIVKEVSKQLQIDESYGDLLPDDKHKKVEEYIKKYNKVCFVGDGINDAACISRSDVGIAMGAFGSDSAIDVSDIVILDDDILNISKVYEISKNTMLTIYENLFLAIGFKILILFLSLLGITNMWLAVFSDVGVLILAVLNSVRLMYKKY